MFLLGAEMACTCSAVGVRAIAQRVGVQVGGCACAGMFLLGAEMTCACSAVGVRAHRHTGRLVCAGVFLLGAEMAFTCSTVAVDVRARAQRVGVQVCGCAQACSCLARRWLAPAKPVGMRAQCVGVLAGGGVQEHLPVRLCPEHTPAPHAYTLSRCTPSPRQAGTCLRTPTVGMSAVRVLST